MMESVQEHIRPAPFISDARTYKWPVFRADLQAGLTVAVFAIPQVVAYAMLAGMPPMYGLYAAMVMAVVAALWGSSPWINTGPTNSAALLTASAVALVGSRQELGAVVFTLILMVGVLRLLLGLFRMGWLLRYVPESALVGFITGAAIFIALGQLHHLLGVPTPIGATFIPKMKALLSTTTPIAPVSVGIGVGVLVFMLFFDSVSKKIPVALCAIILATVGAAFLSAPPRLVGDAATIYSGWPGFSFYTFEWATVKTLFPSALAIAAIGLIEAISIGEMLAMKRRQHLNVNQEFFGQGLSQVLGAFIHGFPGSGSFSRSALMEQVGGSTRFAHLFYGVFMALAVVLLPRWLDRIPVAALAGLLLYIGIKLIDLKRIRRIFETSRADSAVMIITFLVTVFVKIEYGIFAGIAMAMVNFLNRASRLKVYEMLPTTSGEFNEVPYVEGQPHGRSAMVALSIHGDLFFGVAQQLRDQLEEITRRQEPRHIIIRLRRAYSIDFSCWSAFFEFAEGFHAIGGRLYICGTSPEIQRMIRDAGMEKLISPEQLFPATAQPFEAFGRAVDTVLDRIEDRSHLSREWQDYRPAPEASDEPRQWVLSVSPDDFD